MGESDRKSALWPPPEGFVPVPSRVKGIQVYAPAPEHAEDDATRTFKCRHCGGVISYDASEKQLTCPYCGSTQQVEAEAVGRSAAEFEFTLETIKDAKRGWGRTRREVVCESCGSVVSVEPESLTDTCAFCGSNRVLARDITGDILRPTSLIPFEIDKNKCQARVRDWLGRGWMHPAELREVRALRDLAGVYLPYWTFDARIRANWKAEVGTKRTKRYFEDGEWKTRTVIDWNWRSGRVHLPINDHLVPGTGRISQIILDKVKPFDLQGLVEYDPGYLAGWQAKTYDIPLQQAWEIAKKEMRDRAKDACYSDTGSSHVRHMRMTADFADEQWRYILLPIYLLSYRYGQRTFQVMVNGQTGNVAGQKPVAWPKVWLAIAAMLLPGALLGLIGLAALSIGGLGIVGLAVGFILFIAGLIGSIFVLARARASEEI